MGQSIAPDSASIDLVGSYVRRREGIVEIVLADPAFDGLAPDAHLVAARGDDRAHGPVELRDDEHGRRLVACLPRNRVSRGTWALTVVSGSDKHRIDARLLVQGPRPLVLLWGAVDPPSRLPAPRPRPAAEPTAAEPQARGSLASRLAARLRVR